MWPRQTEKLPSKEEERNAEQSLKDLIDQEQEEYSEPGEQYWQNLLVRTNEGIDEVSSGKAISMSWAARVAIPGAISILFFFIGLHYYVPDNEPAQMSVKELVLSLSEGTQDLIAGELLDELEDGPAGLDFYPDPASSVGDEAAEYLMTTGNTSLVLEMLTDSQVEELMGLLRPGDNTRSM